MSGVEDAELESAEVRKGKSGFFWQKKSVLIKNVFHTLHILLYVRTLLFAYSTVSHQQSQALTSFSI